MSATVDKIIDILTRGFSSGNYLDLMREVLADMKVVAPDRRIPERSSFSSHIETYSHVGTYTDPDRKKILVLAVEQKRLNYVENARGIQRAYSKKLIEAVGADAALIAFYTPDNPRWRLSFVRLDYELSFEKGKAGIRTNITPARRYSFLVGKEEPCHTALERFRLFIDKHRSNPTLDELEEAFSVEKVTKDFFESYRDKFLQLQEYLENNEAFISEASLRNYTSAQFAKKLMGQIVFLYFLQKKGWLGVKAWPRLMTVAEYNNALHARGAKSRELIPRVYRKADEATYVINGTALTNLSDEEETFLSTCVRGEPWGTGPYNFMRQLFDAAIKKGANFFETYLEPLFYEALNVNRGEQGYDPALHCRIPFLSGGLFEPLDGYEWKHNTFNIPNEIFSNKTGRNDRLADGILDIFDRYNFTMSEDEPLERDVAIDPEMLGKVFENLLEVNDRKSKGAFYTPREIVHYMCRESLINYLIGVMKLPEQAIRDFIIHGDLIRGEDADVLNRAKIDGNYDLYISEEIYQLGRDGAILVNRVAELDQALQDVCVADPAVGSGAFPLGMLNEIVRARQNLTTYMDLTQKILDPKGAAVEIRARRVNERSARQLKYDTIKNSIFAVDIEPSAVDIAQLRLWLALVIDDEIDPNAAHVLDGHRNPLPLPNLECNILCGNSLIDEFEGVKLVNESRLLGTTAEGQQVNTFQTAFDANLERLMQKQEALYRCDNTNTKAQLLREIADLRDNVIYGQLEGAAPDVLERYEQTKKLASQPFVLWQLDFARVFREKGGFDIVIGNPPYLAYKKMKQEIKSLYNRIYECASGQYDLYGLFFEKGYQILKTRGILSFITSSTYFNNKDFKELRKFLLTNSRLISIINLDESIFDSANLDVAVTTFEKNQEEQRKKNSIAIVKSKSDFLSMKMHYRNQMDFYREDLSYELKLNTSTEDDNLIKKMSEGSIMLGEILLLPRGIEIGANSDLITSDSSKNKEKLLVGKDIKSYQIFHSSKYIEYETDNISVFKERRIYAPPKILIQRIRNLSLKQRIVAAIDYEGFLCTNTLRIGLLVDDSYSLLYLLGLLNSKLINWMFRKYFLNKDIYSYQLKQIPIKRIPKSEQDRVGDIVCQLMESYKIADKQRIRMLENKIDESVYNIYCLNKIERRLIDRVH